MALSDQLSTRVRALLRGADHLRGGVGTVGEWRTARDRWLDLLDPREPRELDETDVRSLIDFLSECGPSRASRRSAAEWSREIDSLVPELLFAGQR